MKPSEKSMNQELVQKNTSKKQDSKSPLPLRFSSLKNHPKKQKFYSPSHSKFTYPISKNIYAKRLKDSDFKGRPMVYVDHEAEDQRGQWRALFNLPPSAPLIVEIGCNGGHVSVAKAATDPTSLFLGMDWKFKQIYRAAEKTLQKKIRNAGWIRGNAERLPYCFSPSEITKLCFYFPDPWTKKSQRKKRLLQAPWFDRIHELLADNGSFELKTDHREYFESVLEEIKALKTDWKLEETSFDLHASCENPEAKQIPEVTLFETLFIRKKLPIHRLVLRKKASIKTECIETREN